MAKDKKPKLTPQQIDERSDARARYRDNFELFCLEQLRIIDRDHPEGAKLVPFVLNDAQRELLRLIERIEQYNINKGYRLQELTPEYIISKYPIKVIILKARKVGISTLLAARAFWRCEFHPHIQAGLMAHRDDATDNIRNMMQRFDIFWEDDEHQGWPLREELGSTQGNTFDWNPRHGSQVHLKTGGSRSGASRSYTYHFLHISEEAHFPDGSDEVATALAASVPNQEVYEESTANGEGNSFYDNWEKAAWIEDAEMRLISGEKMPRSFDGVFRFFWPWHKDPNYMLPLLPGEAEQMLEDLDEDEQELIDRFELNFEQLKWRRMKINGECSRQRKMDPVKYFKQEYPSFPEEAFVSSGKEIFDQRRLSELKRQAETLNPGYYTVSREAEMSFRFKKAAFAEGAQYTVFRDPIPHAQYIIGVDSSEGLERRDDVDDHCISIYRRLSPNIVEEDARYLAHNIGADDLGELAVFLARIYNNAFIVPERQGVGIATCEKIYKLGYTNVYHDTHIGRKKDDSGNEKSFVVGMRTQGDIKKFLVEWAAGVLKDRGIIIKSTEAIRQWRKYKNLNGKFTAPAGDNDDAVSADVLVCWALICDQLPPLNTESLLKSREAAAGQATNPDRWVHETMRQDREHNTGGFKKRDITPEMKKQAALMSLRRRGGLFR